MLLKHIPSVFNIDEAQNLAGQLNADEEDSWTYVVDATPQTGAALVKVKDENGELVGAL